MDTEARLFKIAVFIITLVITGIMLTNIIYYSGMTNGQYPNNTEATAMLWISAIIFTLAALLWIWSIYRMFHKETREEYKKKAVKKFSEWANDTNSGITQDDVNSVKSTFGYSQTSAPTPAPGQQTVVMQAQPSQAPGSVVYTQSAPPPQQIVTRRDVTAPPAPAPPVVQQQAPASRPQASGVLTQGGPPQSTLMANA